MKKKKVRIKVLRAEFKRRIDYAIGGEQATRIMAMFDWSVDETKQ